MIDRFKYNYLQHIIIFPNKICHHNNREERSKETLQKQLYATILNFPYASHINNNPKQPSIENGVNKRLNKRTDINT